MDNPIAPLLKPPIAFAHPATGTDGVQPPALRWQAALEAGASGLAGEVHLTRDGEAIIHDGATIRLGFRRRPIASLMAGELPSWMVRLSDVYRTCTLSHHLALEVTNESVDVVVGLAREAGAERHLWLCANDWRQVATWRDRVGASRLVQVTRLRAIDEGPERRAASLAAAGIDAIRLHDSDWNAGLTTLFHRFGLFALAGTTRHRHRLDALLAAGTDGVTSDEVATLVQAVSGTPPD